MLDDDEEWGDCLDEGLNGQFKVIRINAEFAETLSALRREAA